MSNYEVQHYTLCDGWVNCWSVDETPQTFDTVSDAQAELDDFFKDIEEEMASEDREPDECSSRDDYRIVPVGTVSDDTEVHDLSDRQEDLALVIAQEWNKVYDYLQEAESQHLAEHIAAGDNPEEHVLSIAHALDHLMKFFMRNNQKRLRTLKRCRLQFSKTRSTVNTLMTIMCDQAIKGEGKT